MKYMNNLRHYLDLYMSTSIVKVANRRLKEGGGKATLTWAVEK
jgi:hypothetical protein